MNNGVRISRIEKEIKNDIISADLIARLDPDNLPYIEIVRRHILEVYGVDARTPQDIADCKEYGNDIAYRMKLMRKKVEDPDAEESLSGYSLEYQKYLHEKSTK